MANRISSNERYNKNSVLRTVPIHKIRLTSAFCYVLLYSLAENYTDHKYVANYLLK